MKPRKITQRGTLALIRRPLPPARKIILDAKTKARRKRVKSISLSHDQPISPR